VYLILGRGVFIETWQRTPDPCCLFRKGEEPMSIPTDDPPPPPPGVTGFPTMVGGHPSERALEERNGADAKRELEEFILLKRQS
jgi:hypothetical protein